LEREPAIRERMKYNGRHDESDTAPTEEMMKELNRRRVLETLEAFHAGDIERALSFCSDDVDFFSNAPIDILPHLGHHHSKDDVRQMWQTVHERYSGMRGETQFIAAEDDRVAVHVRAFFVKRRNDRIVQFDIAVFFTLANGKIVKIREIIGTFDLIQQVVGRGLHDDDRRPGEGEHVGAALQGSVAIFWPRR
jgi:ketosteroid isomerase-like protein